MNLKKIYNNKYQIKSFLVILALLFSTLINLYNVRLQNKCPGKSEAFLYEEALKSSELLKTETVLKEDIVHYQDIVKSAVEPTIIVESSVVDTLSIPYQPILAYLSTIDPYVAGTVIGITAVGAITAYYTWPIVYNYFFGKRDDRGDDKDAEPDLQECKYESEDINLSETCPEESEVLDVSSFDLPQLNLYRVEDSYFVENVDCTELVNHFTEEVFIERVKEFVALIIYITTDQADLDQEGPIAMLGQAVIKHYTDDFCMEFCDVYSDQLDEETTQDITSIIVKVVKVMGAFLDVLSLS